MDQKKIGSFLRELRKEKGLTQEQLAELTGVSNRSVSRWETGTNLPDLDILIQLADHYNVELREILDGERKDVQMDKETRETVLKAADYSNMSKMDFSRKVLYFFIAGLVADAGYMILLFSDAGEKFDFLSGLCLGIMTGVLILGVIYNSRYMSKLRALKLRLLGKAPDGEK
ncbi:MAG: helix-turn-helix domain-containing protein [Huintestinicola sp.]|uniref:helix-turn-helix domain-containing protein n=1 Tax=Huintestinicola sp. TaxID=2981661 RepID=UPI003EFF3E1F